MKLFTQIAVFQGLHLSILGMIVFHVKRHKNFRSKFVVSRETTGAKNVVLRKMYKKNIPPKQDVFDQNREFRIGTGKCNRRTIAR